MKLFNYKDWWSWVYWIVLIFIVKDIIIYSDTLVRWKYGYWSIDLVPAVVMLLVLFIIDTIIIRGRMWKAINKLEEANKQ